MQAMNGKAATGVPLCPHPRAVAGLLAAAVLAHTLPPGGAVAAELAGAGTLLDSFGPGAGACFLLSAGAV
jgi:hypothetical protein